MPSMIESPLARLTDEQIEELGREFDAIHDEVFAELGDRDRRYIVSMIEMHRRLVVLGRVLLGWWSWGACSCSPRAGGRPGSPAPRCSPCSTPAADFTANVARNVWAYAIIFCGHFPDQTYTFSQDEVKDESRGGFYVRQLLGAANIDGSPLFHVASGNLGYQIEHHLYPDMPSTRYAEIAPRVKAVCERYELPYNTGPFLRQLGGVQRTILRLAFPGGTPRPKPGPFQGDSDRDGAPAQAATSSFSATAA